jgi:hypothetical protein
MKLPVLVSAAPMPSALGISDVDEGARRVRLAGGGDVPAPLPGCWFTGTECRVGYQTCKYCCGGGNGQSYSKPCGWCIGWWDAPPCF